MYSWDTANVVVGYPRKRTEATAMAEAVRLHSRDSNFKWRAVGATLRNEGVPRRRGHVRPAQPTGKFWIVQLVVDRSA